MKKWLILGLVAAVIIVASMMIAQSAGKIIKAGVETFAPKITGVPITLGEVHPSALRTSSINGLIIGTPKGYRAPYTFRIGKVEAKVDTMSLISDTVVIHHLTLREPEIVYEMEMHGSNLTALGQSIAYAALPNKPMHQHPGNKPQPVRKIEDQEPKQRVIIEHLDIEEAVIRPAVMGENLQALHVPDVHLDNLGTKDKSLSFAEASSQILSALGKSIATVDFRGFVKQTNAEVLQQGSDAANKAFDNVKDAVSGGVGEKLDNAERAVDHGVQGTFQKLKNLGGH